MKIDKACINHNEQLIVNDITSCFWDCVNDDIDNKWWLANMMYLKGVHDMAEALRKVVDA